MTLVDQPARDAIREDLASTLVVEAAAGTGKTTELVQRILALLKGGHAELSAIVAVTFTEKAAGEMKLRLRGEIETARASGATAPSERQHLDAALAALEAAHISTIHGFCSDILRERPVEALVDPLFEVAAEEAKDRLYDESFERWFQAALAAPPEGVSRVLRRRTRDRDAHGPREVLRRAGLSLVDQRDFDAPWRRDPFDRRAAIDGVLERLRAIAGYAKLGEESDFLWKNLAEVQRFMDDLDTRERVRPRDYDGLEADLKTLKAHWTWGYSGRRTLYAKGVPRAELAAQRDATKAELDRVVERCDADLAAALHPELRPIVDEYERLKARAGKLDFLDLLVRTRDLVRDHAGARAGLQKRFTHLLVDEFQDTDPLQAEILLLLAADDPNESDWRRARPTPGKLFVVGDPKQSIYRFRRADVALYEDIKERLVAHGAKLVFLSTSFRSAPSIQRAVNAAFAPVMQPNADGSQAAYVGLEAFRDEPDGRPTLVALPVPRPYGDYGKITAFRVDESIPDAVGAFVDWLVNQSGWTIAEREGGQRVPIQARHVCLLFKRFSNYNKDTTRLYVRALEARRIPHVLVGGRSFYAREEVLALKNALAAIEWPDDELSVFATLRGPFFAVGDDALLAYRAQFGQLHPARPIDEAKLDELTRPVRTCLVILARLHHARNRRPIADTVSQLLEATRAHAGIAIWPTGEQALGNVLRVLDFARRFEAQGATSFRAFVQRLEEESERGGAAEAPVVEEGTDGVRIMTVHKAKGLEFPVVILVDPTAHAAQKEPSRFVDAEKRLWSMPLAGCAPVELLENRAKVLQHDRHEACRLAYVAATRARDLLVVPVVGDEAVTSEWWLDVLYPAMYPKNESRRRSKPAPGCPAFGDDSVRDWPDKVMRSPERSVKPGLHAPSAGDAPVVWWDPHSLDLDKEEDVGLRQQRILSADEKTPDQARDREGARMHDEWRARREASIERGTTPTIRALPVTEAVHLGGAAAAIAVESTDAARGSRPHGKRFGSLVHAVLASTELGAADVDVATLARGHARLLGATAEEIVAATASVTAALRHPLLVRARAPGVAHRREAPVLLRLDDGSLVEGALDLAFCEKTGGVATWTIVDFKTDVELEGRRGDYEAQVALYVRAVARATGEEARGVLLRV